jgi:hypothetical protein
LPDRDFLERLPTKAWENVLIGLTGPVLRDPIVDMRIFFGVSSIREWVMAFLPQPRLAHDADHDAPAPLSPMFLLMAASLVAILLSGVAAALLATFRG